MDIILGPRLIARIVYVPFKSVIPFRGDELILHHQGTWHGVVGMFEAPDINCS